MKSEFFALEIMNAPRFIPSVPTLAAAIFWSICISAFLVPLAWNPWMSNRTELFARLILSGGAVFGLIVWIFAAERRKEGEIKRNPVILAGGVFLLVFLLSSLFSLDPRSSILGSHGWYADGFLSVFAAFVLGWLFANEVAEDGAKTALVAGAFALSFALLSSFGLLAFLGVNVPVFSPVWSAPLIGLLVAGAGLLSGLASARNDLLSWGACWGAMLAGSAGLLASGISVALVPAIAGLFAACTLLLWIARSLRWNRRGFALNLVGLVCFLVFLAVVLASSFGGGDAKMSLTVAGRVLASGPKELLLGTGPGTFLQNIFSFGGAVPDSAILLPSFSPYWGSFLAGIASTMGMAGLLALLLLFGAGIKALFGGIAASIEKNEDMAGTLRDSQGARAMLALVVIIGLAALMAVGMVTSGSLLIFALVLGIASASRRPASSLPFSLHGSRAVRAWRIAGSALAVLGLLALGNLAVFAVAEIKYAKALEVPSAQAQEKIRLLEEAVRLAPLRPEYRLELAQAYVMRGLEELRNNPSPQEADAQEREPERVSYDLRRAIVFVAGGELEGVPVTGALQIAPGRGRIWKRAGDIYSRLEGAAGALEWALRSYEKTAILEPRNASVLVRLSGLYLESGNPELARDRIQLAKKLAPRDPNVLLQDIAVLVKEGEGEEALARAERLARDNPLHPEVLFQVGVLYYNGGKAERAIRFLETASRVAPSFANVRYALGLAYEETGRREEALAEFEKVRELDPNNRQVLQSIEKLEQKEEKSIME